MCSPGAKALLGAVVPTTRPPRLRPLWLRLEYNTINAQDLEAFIRQVGGGRG